MPRARVVTSWWRRLLARLSGLEAVARCARCGECTDVGQASRVASAGNRCTSFHVCHGQRDDGSCDHGYYQWS